MYLGSSYIYKPLNLEVHGLFLNPQAILHQLCVMLFAKEYKQPGKEQLILMIDPY